MIKKLITKIIYKERANSTTYSKFLAANCASFGSNIYFVNPHKTYLDKAALSFIKVGDNVQFSSGVIVLAHDESYSVCGEKYHDYPRTQKYTTIGNNVFIGMNSIILMGAQIGNNVIIGAGSVVSGKLEDNSVYGGNPARKIMSLDEYHERHVKSFEESAKIYFANFYKKNKRWPVLNEMHVYRLLFVDELPTDVNKPKEIVDLVLNGNKSRVKYSLIEEFMKDYKDE